MDPDCDVVVMDAGTGFLKLGFAGEDAPRFFERCAIARKPTSYNNSTGNGGLQTQYCEEAISWTMKDPGVEKVYPVDLVFSSPNSENFRIWSYAIKRINIDPSKCSLVMGSSTKHKDSSCSEKLKWAFEIENFKAISIVHDSVAILRYNNLEFGLIIDIGESSTRLYPIYPNTGLFFPHIFTSDISGRIATLYLREIFRCMHYPLFLLDISIIDGIKYSSSKTLLHHDKTSAINAKPIKLAIPSIDGKFSITFSSEQYMISELFFDDNIFSRFMPGLAFNINTRSLFDLIKEFLEVCPIDLRAPLISNLILTGGTCSSDSFLHRMRDELDSRLHMTYPGLESYLKIHNKDKQDHRISIYKGLCIKAYELKSKPNFWITREEYFKDPILAASKAYDNSYVIFKLSEDQDINEKNFDEDFHLSYN